MKIKELQDRIKDLDPELDIFMASDNNGNSFASMSLVYQTTMRTTDGTSMVIDALLMWPGLSGYWEQWYQDGED